MRSPRDVDDPRLAAAAWSRLAEPGDLVATALVASMGAVAALRWVDDLVGGRADLPNTSSTSGPESAILPARARLQRAVARWAPRLECADPLREVHVLERLGGRLLVPGDEMWPESIDDLGRTAPFALWVRGAHDLRSLLQGSVALVGARACTEYGRRVTDEIAGTLAARRTTTVSGGAYGIDAAAHRAALVAGGPTVAFLAGGVDRLYPAGNSEILRELMESGGAVVSEVPPGSVPNRVRFLHRNRLIAAASRATVVVEAAWRSGSLSTAARAVELGRPVGAVPGPVTSPASTGCHRLLRDGAVCVTGGDEVLELVGSIGESYGAEPPGDPRPGDGLEPEDRATWEALPLRSGATVDGLARAAGLSTTETRAALGRLELAGLAERHDGGWRRGR
ncbi:DNA protecting protein DprA [Paraoerskovia marina]|uniref:DNA protecting protein DprA n=1 Tax=Paraoerskovia marina TaxID=545619 RepID=A0A1H1U1I1_9CELL|nr:DNA-processing protein DprA [Paraoerskovia marina]SDS66106.1 DNA protecting protein DprA [Paraoerskovia marina]